MTKWNDENDITKGIHTVSITCDEATGIYFVHNANGAEVNGYSSFLEALQNFDTNAAVIDILAISKTSE